MPAYWLLVSKYKRKLLLPFLLFLVFFVLLPSTLFAFHNLNMIRDADGPDDVPAQSDLSQMALDTTHLSDSNPSYQVFWSFDDTTYPGGNTGDGCAFFDSNDSGGFADFAICTSFQTGGTGQVQLTEVKLFDCKNSGPNPDEGIRCPFTGGGGDGSNGVIAQDANDDGRLDGKNSFCTLTTTTADPFNGVGTHNTSGQQDPLKDTGISCTIFANELKELDGDIPTGIGLTNVCSFTSPDPESDPKDCIVDPGSGFIVVKKVATPNDGTTFSFTLNNQPFTTIQGSGTSAPIPVVGGATYNLAENVPAGWQLNNATCSNNNSPAALTVPAGQTITCTFTNGLIPNPAYIISKKYTIADGGAAVNQAGDVINYTITLTNTGNVNLTGVTVSDPLLGGVLSGPASESLTTNGIFEVNEVWRYTGSYTVQQSDIDNNGGGDGDIDNTAAATTTQLPTPKTASTSVPLVRAPALAVIKSVVSVKNPNGSFDPLRQVDQAGDLIAYTIVITNTGNTTLHNVTVDDNLAGVTDMPCAATLAPGATCSVQVSYSATQLDIDNNGGGDGAIDNTATADADETAPINANAMVPVAQGPALAVVKKVVSVTNPNNTLDPLKQVDQAGDKISYTIVVTNTGNQTLHNVTVDDDLTGTVDAPCAATLAPGATCTVSVIYTVSQANLDNNGGGDGDIDNTATADADETLPQTASATVPLIGNPALSVVKNVLSVTNPNNTLDPLKQVDQAGDKVTYAIVVTNSGNQTLHNVTVDDNLTGTVGALCAATLAPGASCTVQVSYSATQTDIDNNGGGDSDIDNTATADATETAPQSAAATVPVAQGPALAVVKKVVSVTNPDNTLDPLKQVDQAGDKISYTIVVTNTGNQTLHNVTVDDNLAGVVDAPCAATLAPGATCVVSVSYSASQSDIDSHGGGDGNIDNLATADADETSPLDANAMTPVVQRPQLTVEKRVLSVINPNNSADPLQQVDQVGDMIVYAIVVTNSGNQTLHNVTVDDDRTNTVGTLCAATLAPGASCTVQVHYTTTQSDIDNNGGGDGDLDNTATADAVESDPQSDSATVPVVQRPALQIAKTPDQQTVFRGDTATFTIVVTNIGNMTLTNVAVSDPNAPNCSRFIGTVTVGQVYSYTCQSSTLLSGLTNTATVAASETGPVADDAVVRVADLSINKSPDLQVIQSGASFTFTIRVENTGEVALTNVIVTDALAPSCDRTFATLAVGEVQEYVCVLAGVTASFVNTAIADADQTPPVSDTAAVQVANLLINKSAAPTSLPEPGGLVTFTVDIQNTASTTLTLTALNDAPFGNITQVGGAILATSCVLPQRLTPAGNLQGFRYTCSFTVQLTGEPDDYLDTVTATLQDRHGNQIQIADDATVTITDQLPTVELAKAVSPASQLEPGGAFVYTLTVTNTSVEPVTIASLSDSQAAQAVDFSQCTALVGQSLLPNASRSCQYTVNQSDAGTHPNTATVMVRDNEDNNATDSALADITVNDALPTVVLHKTAAPGSRLEPGGSFVFTLTVTNTSVEPVTITALTDSQSAQAANFSQCTALIGQTLTPNQSVACQYTVTYTETGAYPNQATVTVQDNEQNSASNEDTLTVTVNDALPSVALTKVATPDRLAEPGGAFVFKLTVTNHSVEPVVITALTDSQSAQAATFSQCTALIGQTLTPNQSVSCQYTVNHTNAGAYDNQASVTVRDNENNSATDQSFATVVVGNTLPSVILTKHASPDSRTEPGGAFVFTLVITNTSVEPVVITALSDNQSAQAADFSQCQALVGQTLAIGAVRSCQYTVVHTDAGVYQNEANVTVRDNENDTATSRDVATVTVNDALPLVSLRKSAGPTRLDEPGGAFVFTLTVTNNGVEPVRIAELTDSQQAQALDFSQCTALVGQQLAPGQSRACQYTVTHTNAGSYGNQANVTVYDNEENPATDQATTTVAVNDLLPLIRVSKSAQPGAVLETGGDVLFLVEVYNDGVEPLRLTALVDDHFGDLNGVGSCAVPQTVAPGGVYRCTFTKTISGHFGDDHHDTVTATVNDDDGNTTTGSDDATVTLLDVKPNLQVTKDDKLQVDADHDGRVSPGDTLRYVITVINSGNGAAFNTVLNDTPDAQTKLVPGTVVTSKGTVLLGNGPTDQAVAVEIGDVAPNGAERVRITFDVIINPQITLPLVRNQAVVTNIAGQDEPPVDQPSDDPSTPKIDDETITEVFAPTAEEETEEPANPGSQRLFLPLINKR